MTPIANSFSREIAIKHRKTFNGRVVLDSTKRGACFRYCALMIRAEFFFFQVRLTSLTTREKYEEQHFVLDFRRSKYIFFSLLYACSVYQLIQSRPLQQDDNAPRLNYSRYV